MKFPMLKNLMANKSNFPLFLKMNCANCERKNMKLFEASLHFSTVVRQNALLIERLDKQAAEIYQLKKMLRGLLQTGLNPHPKEMLKLNI